MKKLKQILPLSEFYKTLDIIFVKEYIYDSIFDESDDKKIKYNVGDITKAHQEYKHYDERNPENNILDTEWVFLPNSYYYVNKDYFLTLEEHREKQINNILE